MCSFPEWSNNVVQKQKHFEVKPT